MKFICIHPRFASLTSHHFNESWGLKQELRREWSFPERSQRFLNVLRAEVNGDLGVDDCVMLTVSTQLEAHALVRWWRALLFFVGGGKSRPVE